MFLKLLALPRAGVFLSASVSLAQDTVPSPLTDLAELKLRADQMQDGRLQLSQIAGQVQGGVPLNDLLAGMLNVSPDSLGSGLRYAVAGQVRVAQLRAEKIAMILSNDLDGDGSVSRDEIADALTFGQSRRGSAAETLITYDADRNDILSPDEIRTAVSVTKDMGGRRDNSVIASILDLDADGTLTPAELQRADAALRLPEALQ